MRGLHKNVVHTQTMHLIGVAYPYRKYLGLQKQFRPEKR
jgi:hypothetical protein